MAYAGMTFQEGSETAARRSSWRSQERRSTEGSNEDGENLMQQADVMQDIFYHCYVKGQNFKKKTVNYEFCC